MSNRPIRAPSPSPLLQQAETEMGLPMQMLSLQMLRPPIVALLHERPPLQHPVRWRDECLVLDEE